MSRRNRLLSAPPYPVQHALAKLGENLRTARLRRNLSQAEAAEKIGTHRRVVADAEKGKASTAIAVYAALLWAYGLNHQLEAVADPREDSEGLLLAAKRERVHARHKEALSNDF